MAISIEDSRCTIAYEVYKANQKIDAAKKEFTVNNHEEIDPYILRYIENMQAKYRHNYISLISNATHQGILSHCNDNAFSKKHIRKDDVKYVCINDKWGVYISKEGLLTELEYFDELSIDLYYSPFSILSHYIDSHTIADQATLFILNRENSMSIIIVKNNQYLFGTHYNLDEETAEIEDIENDIEELVDEDDEEMFSLDEFSLDDDLDDIEDLEHFDDVSQTQEDDTTQELEILGRDLKTFTYIKSAIDEFYAQGNVDFIDKIIIYDNENISSDVINFIEDDLLLSVDIKNINILDTAIDFIKKEDFS